MAETQIGIKLANGEFYPVMDDGTAAGKRLVVTTVQDEQPSVQIDVYRGSGPTVDTATYVGSLVIGNIPPMPKGEPDISLDITLDDQGNLTAFASEKTSGEYQKLSVSLTALSEEETYEIPDFEFDESSDIERFSTDVVQEENPFVSEVDSPVQADTETTPESGIFGENTETTVTTETLRAEQPVRRGPSVVLIIIFALIGTAIALAFAFFVYKCSTAEKVPPLESAPAVSQPATPPPPVATLPTPPAPSTATPPAPSAATPQAKTPKPIPVARKPGVWYKIKWGDTLWDLSYAYYRNPWLYPKIAKYNKIKNPDLIISGRKIYIPPK